MTLRRPHLPWSAFLLLALFLAGLATAGAGAGARTGAGTKSKAGAGAGASASSRPGTGCLARVNPRPGAGRARGEAIACEDTANAAAGPGPSLSPAAGEAATTVAAATPTWPTGLPSPGWGPAQRHSLRVGLHKTLATHFAKRPDPYIDPTMNQSTASSMWRATACV